jgi:hypothetical protein
VEIGECYSGWAYEYHGDGGLFYGYRGGCRTEQFVLSLTLTQDEWAKSWISEGSILMDSTPPTSEGHVKKRFLLKVGPLYSTRIAFYFPGYLGVTHETVSNNLQADRCNDPNCTDFDSYTKIGSNDHDQHDCPTSPYDVNYITEDGPITITYDPPAVPEPTVIPNLKDEVIQHMIYNHMLTVPIIEAPSSCRYQTLDQKISETHMINIFMLDCAGDPPQSSISVSYTDTKENWEKTTDHCANVFLSKEENIVEGKTMITKTYAILGANNPMKTVAFYRI